MDKEGTDFSTECVDRYRGRTTRRDKGLCGPRTDGRRVGSEPTTKDIAEGVQRLGGRSVEVQGQGYHREHRLGRGGKEDTEDIAHW